MDVPNFAAALRVVVRQDPDCILIGEMRDRETMLAAIQAAETGHLVMGSLHCADAQISFARILEFFDRSEHSFIRSSLATSLRAIMCQRLIPGVKSGTRFPATEVLLANSIVRQKISHEEDEDLPAILHQCRDEGMRDYTYSLCELVNEDKILRTVAMDYAPNREALSSALKGNRYRGRQHSLPHQIPRVMNPRRALQKAIPALIIATAGLVTNCSVVRSDEVAPSKTIVLTSQSTIEPLKEQRRRFQCQELITATPNTWIFNPGDPPRIVWRDVEEVRRLGFKGPLHVRWFDSRLEEAAIPSEPGRWVAWIDGTAPNGFAFRRALTFYARPKNFLMYFAPDLSISLPYLSGPINAEVWQEHQSEMTQLSAAMLLHTINDSEAGTILVAGLAESKPLGRPARLVDSASVRNQDFQLALKLKVEGLQKDAQRSEAAAPPYDCRLESAWGLVG